jgi:drug/metabolite transporter (DMT)-like permease
VLGAILAVLSAATFALNNASMRRGVVTGTPSQGMAVTIPIGVCCFLLAAIASGEIFRLAQFPPMTAAWMAGVGLLHFLFGRYCNYRANQEAGVNLTAPVVQLQVIVTLVFAVIILREPCTILQAIGGVLILAGSFITQRQPPPARKAATAGANSHPPAPRAGETPALPPFAPRYLAGYIFASGAALGYGTTPIMARIALEHSGPTSSILGGLIAYGAAGAVVAVALLWRPLRRNVMALKRENIRWFIYSGVFVALAQGFFYAAVAVAPIMLVVPILQLSLVFRLFFAMWLTPDHEVFGPVVVMGVAVSLIGSLTVAVDSDVILNALAIPDALAGVLRLRV